MRFGLLVLTLLMVAWLAVGQAPSPAPAAGTRVVVVNSERVLAESNEGKAVVKEMEAKFAPKQKELQARALELERLQTEYQQKQASFSDAERQRRALEIQQKQKSAERFQEDLNAEVNAAREDSLGRLGKRVSDVVQKYGAEKQYTLILDAGASGALYVGAGADITNEILAAYNQAHPGK